jgi:hypothetical protein
MNYNSKTLYAYYNTTPYDLQLENTLHVYYNTTLYDLQLEKHYMFIIIQLNMIYDVFLIVDHMELYCNKHVMFF